MPNIFDLEAIVSSISQGLDATLQGNAALSAESLNNAMKGIEGLRSAAATRAQIVQTQQSEKLFPDVQEQMGQRTALGAIDVRQRKASEKRSDATWKLIGDLLDTASDPEMVDRILKAAREWKITEGLMGEADMRTATEARRKKEELGLAVTKTGISLEEDRGITSQKKYQAEAAEADLATARAREMLDVDIPRIEAAAKAEFTEPLLQAQVNAQLAALKSADARLKAARTAAEKLKAQQDAEASIDGILEPFGISKEELAAYRLLTESKIVPDNEQITRELGSLYRAQANIRDGATLADALDEAGVDPGLSEKTKKWATERFGTAQRSFTTAADREAAVAILQSHINALESLSKKIIDMNLFPQRKVLTDEEKRRLLGEKNRLFGGAE